MSTLETRAIIVQVEGRQALVQASQVNGCEQCNGNGCGASRLTKLFCTKPRQFEVDNPINARVGDEVVISVPEGALLRGAGLVYLFPLLLLVTGAMLGSALAGLSSSPVRHDEYAVAGALLGVAAGFIAAKWISSVSSRQQFVPYIARSWREDGDHG